MRLTRTLLSSLLATALIVIGLATPASAQAAWQLTVTRIDPTPQASGTTMRFRIQAQCSAVDEAECRDSEIRWPASPLTSFSLPTAHPAIESFAFDAGTSTWFVNLQDTVQAGTAIEFDVIASSANHITPNGTPISLNATVTASNTASATASATGAWSAAANLGVEKYLEFGPNTDALLDVPVRYYIYPCDPTMTDTSAPGHLYVEGVQIVDTLPTGVVFNSASAGGAFDSGTNKVTWTPAGNVQNESCAFTGPSAYWVEVVFPSTTFGPTSGPPAVIEATNTVDISGYPIGKLGDPASLLTDSDSLLHGFSLPNPLGTHTKYASTPYYGLQNITYENDRADFTVDIRTSAAGTTPYFARINDPLPCLDYTPNAATQYESHPLNGSACAEPAFTPDLDVSVDLDPAYLTMTSAAAFTAAHPTIPLRIRTTSGADVVVDMPFNQMTPFGQVRYLITGANLTAALGGAGVSDIALDSGDFGLQVKVVPYNQRNAIRLKMRGNVAPDTVAHPMLNQYRVRNYGHFTLRAGSTETYIGAIQDSVLIVDRAPVLGVTKSANSAFGYISIDVTSYGGALRTGEDLIVTDLLPVGYRFNALSQTFLGYGSGSWYWAPGTGFGTGASNTTGYPALGVDIRSHINVEVIDDYNGTGRQLLRVTFPEPPTSDGWRGMAPGASSRVSFTVTPSPLTLAATNVAQAFPSDPTSASLLQCQNGVFQSPYAASTSDPNDLDDDGTTAGDAYCAGSTSIVPDSTIVNIASVKAVRGDKDSTFRRFPAIGAIGSTGGTADFQINLTNVGGVSLRDLVIYDVLPFVGDTGLSQTQVGTARGSQWATEFAGVDPATVPAGAQIEYSGSTNPCRNELTTPVATFPTGCVNDWSTSYPSGSASLVRALRITFPSGGLASFDPTDKISINYAVTYPSGVVPGQIAWNNFAYAANRVDTGSAILPSEPPKVGLGIPQVDLTLTKSATPTTLLAGQPATYTVTIDHQGAVSAAGVYTLPAGTAYNVVAKDNLGNGELTVVPNSSTIVNTRTGISQGVTFDETTGDINIDEFGPNDTYVLTYRATRSTVGSTTNTAQITATPGVTDIDSTPGNSVASEDDQSSAIVSWVQPRLELDKLVESEAGSGVFIEADASDGLSGVYQRYHAVAYRFVVRNPSTIAVSNIALTDDLAGFVCNRTIGTLAAGASTTIDCTWPFGYAPGQHVNTATVTGSVTVAGTTVTASDTDTAVVNVVPPVDISLTKQVDGDNDGTWASAEAVPFGATFKYSLTATNAATAGDATGVTVIERLPAGVTITSAPAEFDIATATWTIGDLAAGETATITFDAKITDLAAFRAGTGVNTAEVSAIDQLDIDSTPNNSSTTEDDIDTATVTVTTHAVGDLVFRDANNNGVFDGGEVGIADVTVQLVSDGNVVATVATDGTGHYAFDDLAAGDYVIRIAPSEFAAGGTLEGWQSSGIDELDPNTNTDNNDNGISGSSVESGLVTLGSNEPTGETSTIVTIAPDGQANLTVDFGFFQLASIGDYVWNDANNDGIQQTTEAGIDGATVELLDGDGNVLDTVTTSGGGLYVFDGLVPGDYQIHFDVSTLPIDLRPTTANSGADDADSDGDATTGVTPVITLTSGEHNMTIDFGARPASTELVLSKVALGDAVASQPLDWRITLTNRGPDAVLGIVSLVDELPEGLVYEGVTSESDSLECRYDTDLVVVTCDADGLAAEATLSAVVHTNVSASGGSVVNTAVVKSSGAEPPDPESAEVEVKRAEANQPTTTTTTTTPATTTIPRAVTPATLSYTGAASIGPMLAGLAMLTAGLGLAFTTRRRRY